MLSGVRDSMRERAGNAMSKAKAAVAKGEYMNLPSDLATVVKERADITALREAGFGAAGEQLAARRRNAQAELLRATGGVRLKMLLAVRELIKTQAVADPDMWRWVKRKLKSIIDLFFDDLAVYIETVVEDSRQATLGQVESNVVALGELGKEQGPWLFSPYKLRAFILNRYLPYDVSIFGQCKDPVFWVLTILSLVSSYGIRIFFFTVLLMFEVMKPPPDEYQLTGYILTFKGCQFLSSGVCMSVYAAVRYYMCVHTDGTHTCDVDGPGASMDLASGAIDFCGSCILVWVAFLILPCSERSAGEREIGGHQATAEDVGGRRCCGGSCRWDPQRGGRLAGLLGYDFFCFVVSCALLYVLAYFDRAHLRPGGEDPETAVSAHDFQAETQTWNFRTAVFWVRVFYSMLAFPFTIFMIPGINSILTHTTATGYNRYGFCVPYMLHPVKEEDGDV